MNDILQKALQALSTPGGVVLVPTETVYGLVCDWQDEAARDRIYKLKGRSENKPLAMFADSAAERINSLAATYIGDVVLEKSGVTYTFVEDYADEL